MSSTASEAAAVVAAIAFQWPDEQLCLFRRLLENVINSPDEVKFRRLKLHNAKINSLLATPGARDAFLALGWTISGEGDALELALSSDLTMMVGTLHTISPTTIADGAEAVPMAAGEPWPVTVLRGPLRTRLELTSLSPVGALAAAIEQSAALGRMPRSRQRLLAGYPPQALRELREDGKPFTLEELGLKTVMLEDVWEEVVSDLRTGKASFVQLAEVFARPALVALALRDNRDFVKQRAEQMLQARIADQSLSEVRAARLCFRLLWPPGDPATHDARLAFCGRCAFATVAGGRQPPLSRADLEGMNLREQVRAVRQHAEEAERTVEHFVVEVARGELFSSSVRQVAAASAGELHRPLEVRFTGEAAEDAGGLRREFFNEFGRSIAGATGLWKLTPAGSLVPEHAVVAASHMPDAVARQAVYRACGRIFGLALCQAQEAQQADGGPLFAAAVAEQPQPLLLGLPLASFFIRGVQGNYAETVQDLQAELNREQHINSPDFRCNPKFLELTLTEQQLEGQLSLSYVTSGGSVVDLVPGGRDICVTEDLKEQWLRTILRHELFESIEEAAAAFRTGVCDLVGAAHIVLLSPTELREAWAGRSSVSDDDLQTWKGRTEVNPVVAQQAEWLFNFLRDEPGARPRVLKFATGSDRWPVVSQGFKFAVEPMDGSDESLPSAMTCGNMLQLPRYTGPEPLREKLLLAVDLGVDLQKI